MTRTKLLLVFPPSFAIDQPYLALPALVGYLRSRGIEDVSHWDLNIEAFRYFMQKDVLAEMAGRVKARRREMETRICELSPDEKDIYRSLCKAELSVAPVMALLSQSEEYFLHPKMTTNMDEYTLFSRCFSQALQIVSVAHHPTTLSLHDCTMRFSAQHSAEILAATESSENPYREYFLRLVTPRLAREGADVIGFSVASMSQIIPAFTLARMIREGHPEVRVVFGGQVFNRLADRLPNIATLFDLVDYFVLGEGETALLRLVNFIEGNCGIESVPNLIYRHAGKVQQTPVRHSEDVNQLPCPDFDDLDLTRYFSPKPVLPYQPVRGCYWNRCAFCNHHVVHELGARPRDARKVIDDLRRLQERYNTDYFTLVNESISPSQLQIYSSAILDSELKIEWYAGARFEKDLSLDSLRQIRKSGCRKLYFGLETGSQRILSLMQKGTRIDVANRIFDDCRSVEMAVHLFIMIGFPAEKSEDLSISRNFILDMLGESSPPGFSYYVSIFQLKPFTDVMRFPEKYGISKISETRNCDLEYLYSFVRASESENINYDRELAELEAVLDSRQNPQAYPENVVHYLVMREAILCGTRQSLPSSPHTELPTLRHHALRLRKGIGIGQIQWTDCSQASKSGERRGVPKRLIYDLRTDDIFEIIDDDAWEIIRDLARTSGFAASTEAVAGQTEENSLDSSKKIVDKLVDSNILQRVAELGEQSNV